MKEGIAKHPVQSEKAGLARVLVNNVAMVIDDSAVSEPGRGSWEEGLNENSSEVHPTCTPHVGIQLWSLCRHHSEVGSKYKR